MSYEHHLCGTEIALGGSIFTDKINDLYHLGI